MRNLFGVLMVGLVATVADAQRQSAITITPDSALTLIQKDVGGDRWAIARNRETGAVSGNVFSPGGAQFVHCLPVSTQGGDASLSCRIGGNCERPPCPANWGTAIDVTLPASFFAAPEEPAGDLTGLRWLIGAWVMRFTVGDPFTFRYTLAEIRNLNIGNAVIGTDSNDGSQVIAAHATDLTGRASAYDFGLFDEDSTNCKLYLFDRLSDDRLRGVVIIALHGAAGECRGLTAEYAMTGGRDAGAVLGGEVEAPGEAHEHAAGEIMQRLRAASR